MVRGWYHNIHRSQKVMSLEEVAALCCSTSLKVKDWLSGKVFANARTKEYYVNASEVVSFLVRNSLPIPPLLLPPETLKILFMASNEYEFLDREEQFDVICRYFAEQYNVLVETSMLSKTADLFPLRFSPDVIVFFLEFLNQQIIETIISVSNRQPVKTILLVDDSFRDALHEDLPTLPYQLVASKLSPRMQLNTRLRLAFDN